MRTQSDLNNPPGNLLTLLTVLLLCLTACATPSAAPITAPSQEQSEDAEHNSEAELPAITPLTFAAGEKVHIMTTTTLIADVVTQVGGDHVVVNSLIGPGVDPHSFSATPQDVRNLSEAQIIFINGLHLEESMESLWVELESGAPIVAVNIDVPTIQFGANPGKQSQEVTPETNKKQENAASEGEGDLHEGVDPHTWQSVSNVKIWVENIEQALSELDPANAAAYAENAEAYQQTLGQLDADVYAQVALIPEENRKLVTDHETFGYFALEYDFDVIGAVIPSLSTSAEPSAQMLAALQDQIQATGVKVIFIGATVNPDQAQQLAADLGIQVVPLFSDALSAADGPAATYIDFMRYNVNAIVNALK